MLTLTRCQDHILTEIYGFYGLKHHIVEIGGGVTRRDKRTNERTTMEDRATQPLGCWKAEFRNFPNLGKPPSKKNGKKRGHCPLWATPP